MSCKLITISMKKTILITSLALTSFAVLPLHAEPAAAKASTEQADAKGVSAFVVHVSGKG